MGHGLANMSMTSNGVHILGHHALSIDFDIRNPWHEDSCGLFWHDGCRFQLRQHRLSASSWLYYSKIMKSLHPPTPPRPTAYWGSWSWNRDCVLLPIPVTSSEAYKRGIFTNDFKFFGPALRMNCYWFWRLFTATQHSQCTACFYTGWSEERHHKPAIGKARLDRIGRSAQNIHPDLLVAFSQGWGTSWEDIVGGDWFQVFTTETQVWGHHGHPSRRLWVWIPSLRSV